ncbi:hypothetical protein A2810_01275 [candidate division Kazan bacterium RIFCSPHIGHO2_01_FULL_49_10]|nr:MAG: hypothetical protein A2810_01275 [candidate division Kazan bacterium RIFCSPHIGHO2_01_FULL_49_10]
MSLGSGCYSYVVDGVSESKLWWAPFTLAGYFDFIDQGQFPVARCVDGSREGVESWATIARLKTGGAITEMPHHLVGQIEALIGLGLLEKKGGLRLTTSGVLIEDLIYASLIPEAVWREFSRKRRSLDYTKTDARYDWFFEPNTVLKFQAILRQ